MTNPYYFIALVLSFFVVAASTILFLLNELHKKFGFVSRFVQGSNQQLRLWHSGAKKGEMRRVTLSWDRPFAVLVGFDLTLFSRPGFDYYGYAESLPDGDRYIITIETWFGKNEATFAFLVNQAMVGSKPTIFEGPTKATHVTARYEPHWFQRYLGI